MTTGKLELIIKINELPTDVQTNKDNWKTFELDCDGRVVSVTLKPKIWKKLEDAATNYPQWVAAIAGKMGESTSNSFVLSEPNIQVFEKKPKEPKPEGTVRAVTSFGQPRIIARPGSASAYGIIPMKL